MPPAFRPLHAIASTYPDKQGTATKVGYKQDTEQRDWREYAL